MDSSSSLDESLTAWIHSSYFNGYAPKLFLDDEVYTLNMNDGTFTCESSDESRSVVPYFQAKLPGGARAIIVGLEDTSIIGTIHVPPHPYSRVIDGGFIVDDIVTLFSTKKLGHRRFRLVKRTGSYAETISLVDGDNIPLALALASAHQAYNTGRDVSCRGQYKFSYHSDHRVTVINLNTSKSAVFSLNL